MSRSRHPGAPTPLTVVLSLLVALTLPTSFARAHTSPPSPSFETTAQQLADLATAVVVGTVTESESLWLDGRLMTLASVTVEDHLAGSTPDEIAVLVAGGVDADRRIPIAAIVPGQPQLAPGRRGVLFLRDYDEGSGLVPHPHVYVVVADERGEWVLDDSPESATTLRTLRAVLAASVSGGAR